MMIQCDAVIGSALITQSFRGLESPLILAEPPGAPGTPPSRLTFRRHEPLTWNQQLSTNINMTYFPSSTDPDILSVSIKYQTNHDEWPSPTEKQITASLFQQSPVDGDGHTNRQPGTILQLAVISTGRNHIWVPRDDIGLSSTHPTHHREQVETGAHVEA